MPSTTTETQTEDHHPLRDEELHKKLDALASRFDKVEAVNAEFKVSLEFTQEEVKDLKEENAELRESLKELSLEIKRNTYAIQGLSNKHENLETTTRKKNIIFEGVPENTQGRENLQETICQIFSEMRIEKAID